jgi:hypothetical protein
MRLRSTLALGAASALAISLTAGSTSSALASTQAARHHGQTTYVALTGGATTLALDPGTAQVLTANGISVAPVSEARVTSAGIAFPIQGGLVKARNLAGSITHSGGLMVSAGGKDLTIRDFTINTKRKTLTAFVDEVGKRLTILDLNLNRIKVAVTKKRVAISNVKAVLNEGAAAALNGYYGVSLFKGGLKIGTASVNAKIKVLKG